MLTNKHKRVIGILLMIAALLVFLAGCIFYVGLSSLACGYRTSPGPCPIKFDWEAIQFIFLPALVVATPLLGGGLYIFKKSRKD